MTANELLDVLGKLGVKVDADPAPTATTKAKTTTKPATKATPKAKATPKVTTPRGESFVTVQANQGDALATYGIVSITRWIESAKGTFPKGGLALKTQAELEYVIEQLIEIHRVAFEVPVATAA